MFGSRPPVVMERRRRKEIGKTERKMKGGEESRMTEGRARKWKNKGHAD